MFHFLFDRSAHTHTHTYIYIDIIYTPLHTLSLHPPPPPYLQRQFFSHLHFMCTKGELGGSFCIERLSMNVPPDRYHTKANTELEEEEQRDNSFISN